jgi:hypothetical protein
MLGGRRLRGAIVLRLVLRVLLVARMTGRPGGPGTIIVMGHGVVLTIVPARIVLACFAIAPVVVSIADAIIPIMVAITIMMATGAIIPIVVAVPVMLATAAVIPIMVAIAVMSPRAIVPVAVALAVVAIVISPAHPIIAVPATIIAIAVAPPFIPVPVAPAFIAVSIGAPVRIAAAAPASQAALVHPAGAVGHLVGTHLLQPVDAVGEVLSMDVLVCPAADDLSQPVAERGGALPAGERGGALAGRRTDRIDGSTKSGARRQRSSRNNRCIIRASGSDECQCRDGGEEARVLHRWFSLVDTQPRTEVAAATLWGEIVWRGGAACPNGAQQTKIGSGAGSGTA